VRKMTRNPQWQAMMLTKPVAERLEFAARAREASTAHGASISEDITDVNSSAIEQALREADVSIMLHGHTHRPQVHSLTVDERDCTRIVLGDWFERGSMVRWNEDGPVLSPIQRRTWDV
ncbi:MAG: UDP-2,3-diacylglucosamine diphosphatase, partial [Gammaproteobacteria bacterium]